MQLTGQGLISYVATTVSEAHFADLYIERSRSLNNPLCVGLDPHLDQIPPEFGVRPNDPTCEATTDGVARFFSAVVEICKGRVAAVKPQSAFFEQMGHRGVAVLEALVREARSHGLLVVLDAKRGDIGSTAEAYAKTYLYPKSPCQANALTLNPYLGLDSLEPFVKASVEYGSGLFVLARTSNPGAADFQSQDTGGEPLYVRVAERLSETAERLKGETGWSNLGVVAGATFPEEARRLRELLPNALFLVPGYGAQGASVKDTLAGFVAREGRLEGGLVSSSRAILYGLEPPKRHWHGALKERLKSACSELSKAIAQ